MGDDGLWSVRPIRREDLASGGLVKASGTMTAVFDSAYIVPNRLAKFVRDPFRVEQDED